MTRIAIYARSASELQSASQITHQTTQCEECARIEGWTISETYIDRAVSGVSRGPELERALLDAKAGKFERLLVTDLARVTRNQAELKRISAKLESANVSLFTLDVGDVSPALVRRLSKRSPSVIQRVWDALCRRFTKTAFR